MGFGAGAVHTCRLWCLRHLAGAVLLAAVVGAAAPASAGDPAKSKLAILPFELEDNSGEAGLSTRHDPMLEAITRTVGDEIAASGLYDVIPGSIVAGAVTVVNPGTHLRGCNGCERDIAKRVGADRVMVGWIFKMSSLVLTLHVVIKDVTTGKVFDVRVRDFRGDNERAWKNAAKNMVRSLKREI